jgi:hypothetical protein
MRRNFLPPLISIFFLFSPLAHGQAWSGLLTPSRAIDWTHAGLPSTITYGTGGSACNGSTANCVESTTNPWTPPTRVQSGSTINCANSPSDVSTINNAIASAKPGSYVLLGATTCDIASNLDLYGPNGVTLRGSGPQSTVLNLSGSGTMINFGNCCMGVGSGALSASSYGTGTTTITLTGVASSSYLTAGNVAWIQQCDLGWKGSGIDASYSYPSCTSGSYSDPGGIWVCGIDYTACTFDNNNGGSHNYQKQNVLITGVTNNGGGSYTVTFTPGLYMPNWSANNNAQMIWQNPATGSFGMGLEDLTVNLTFNGNEQIAIGNTYGSWVKGIRLIGYPTNTALSISSVHSLIFNNYIYGENHNNLYSATSEPVLRSGDSDNLLLNNIITGGNCVWADGQIVGDVIAYNFCRDSQTPYYIGVSLDHEPYESYLLTEGNEFPEIHDDDTHGTHDLDTYFRNYVRGWDSPYVTMNPWAVDIDPYQRFDNLIGNAIGGALSTAYQGTSNSVGNEYVIPTTDALSVASLMRWGNCDVINAGCRFVNSEVPASLSSWPNSVPFQNSVPANNSLPCSFFISGSQFTTSPCSIFSNGGTGLSWWNVCTTWSTFPTACSASHTQPFPSSGPDQTGGPYVNGHSYDNAAATAYEYLPVDKSLQNSFTITGSSWSNSSSACAIVSGGPDNGSAPCEILTVSLASINNGSAEHIMGGFQLSGVNAACIPPGLPPNGEILMTASNTLEIAYSLPSNPGVSCAGTLLFPDIRQFDERVYQADSSGNSSVNPPTGMSAVVQ